MHQCWRLDQFASCVERIHLTASRLDFFTSKRTSEDLQTFRTELPKCIQLSRNVTKACEGANIEPAEKFLGAFFEKSLPGYSENNAVQRGSSLAAVLSVVVALIFSKHA
ncbi:hypothetical protein V5799_010880 [Amblyomma americanum]|uniref:Uncharacterized protein n=1 Tax=Amblyomma americanum TaxID=6943 RepID=A0AAQ4EIH1_AMBAM